MTATPTSPKVLVLIRTSMRPGCDLAAYEALEARMAEILAQMPGYLGAQGFTGEDGESLGIVAFASHEALLRWRDHPEHLDAQRAGRERFYSTYEMKICNVERAYGFALDREPQRVELIG